MVNHQLKLNDNKTEFIIIGSRHQLSKVRMDSINVGLSEIKSASSLRDLGAWFDECMTMNKHVSKVCSKAFGALFKINKIRKFLTEETTKTLIHAFISSHLDYCNSLLYGIAVSTGYLLSTASCTKSLYSPSRFSKGWLHPSYQTYLLCRLRVTIHSEEIASYYPSPYPPNVRPLEIVPSLQPPLRSGTSYQRTLRTVINSNNSRKV